MFAMILQNHTHSSVAENHFLPNVMFSKDNVKHIYWYYGMNNWTLIPFQYSQIEMLGLQNDVLTVPRERMVRRLYYGGKLKVFPTGIKTDLVLLL